ncbi:MAG: hypothetical protein ABUT39_13910 [Acidobacteriota bacterium]
MTLSIELPKDLEQELSAEADQLGLPLPEYALRLLAVARRPEARPADGASLVSYWRKESLVGSRPDIADSQKHARALRERAGRRD